MKNAPFHRSMRVECPLNSTFAFFADPANLEALTPPWLRFRMLTPGPVAMGPGVLLDYRIVIHGIPMRWQSEITTWEPPVRFVDEQRRGPYRRWVHEHRFEEEGGGTRIHDDVDYLAPGASWPGGAWIDRLLVAPDLARIFDYRQRRIAELLQPGPSPAEGHSGG